MNLPFPVCFSLRNIVFLIAEGNFTVLHHTCAPHKLNYMLTAFAGAALGMENWLRITFATEPARLKQGLERLKSFCQRHQSQIN
jgi:hypothetical protein